MKSGSCHVQLLNEIRRIGHSRNKWEQDSFQDCAENLGQHWDSLSLGWNGRGGGSFFLDLGFSKFCNLRVLHSPEFKTSWVSSLVKEGIWG